MADQYNVHEVRHLSGKTGKIKVKVGEKPNCYYDFGKVTPTPVSGSQADRLCATRRFNYITKQWEDITK